jgi:hypothetical protein
MNKVKQVFTFGYGQEHENCYVIIYGKDKGECRDKMFKTFGSKWAFQYDSEELAGVEKWNIKLLKTIK